MDLLSHTSDVGGQLTTCLITFSFAFADLSPIVSDFQNEITVPTHRVNDALTALVRAKIVLKVFSQVSKGHLFVHRQRL
jgi:hypothetical protein